MNTPKLEPGCLALIVAALDPDDIGKTVTVIRHVGREAFFIRGDGRLTSITGSSIWEISIKVGAVTARQRRLIKAVSPFICERNLMPLGKPGINGQTQDAQPISNFTFTPIGSP